MLWRLTRRGRRRHALLQAPVTPIARLQVDTRARIVGKVRPFDGPERHTYATFRTSPLRGEDEGPFPATYSGRTCVFMSSESRDVEGRMLEERAAGVLFVVVDHTGIVVVDLRHVARIDPLSEVTPRSGSFLLHERCYEWAIQVGDRVTVFGTVVATQPGLHTIAGTRTIPCVVSTDPAVVDKRL